MVHDQIKIIYIAVHGETCDLDLDSTMPNIDLAVLYRFLRNTVSHFIRLVVQLNTHTLASTL